MGVYKEIYDLSANAGALEGYVYPKEKMDLSYLPQWVDHLVNQYRGLPAEVREDIQDLCSGIPRWRAIVRGSAGTVAGKQEALRAAGVEVLESPIHVAQWAKNHGLR